MKKYILDEIKSLMTSETVEGSVEIEDEFGNIHNIDEDIKQAEKDVEKIKNNTNVNFRWSEFEVKRAKKIAKKMGMPYQTYIKFALKQTMDKDEKQFG
jgi:predicted DNA binding CopG/RHH family protein